MNYFIIAMMNTNINIGNDGNCITVVTDFSLHATFKSYIDEDVANKTIKQGIEIYFNGVRIAIIETCTWIITDISRNKWSIRNVRFNRSSTDSILPKHMPIYAILMNDDTLKLFYIALDENIRIKDTICGLLSRDNAIIHEYDSAVG